MRLFSTRQPMEIQKNGTRDSCELLISGRIDGDGATRLDELLSELLFPKRIDQPDLTTIYVDLRGATFLCSSGLRVLMQHSRTMRNRQGQLRVSHPSPETSEALKMAGLYDQLVEQDA